MAESEQPKPELYCTSCHHMTYYVDGKCAWCKSDNVSPAGGVLKERRYRSRPQLAEEPDTYRQTHYTIGCRLSMGFSIMRGHDV